VNHYVLRMWLSDRPGVLGQIATAIGAVGADVEGIDILERGGGQAIDEMIVGLPATVTLEALIAKLQVIDGLGIEDVRSIEPGLHDAGTAALQTAASLVVLPTELLHEQFCVQVADLVDATWVLIVDLDLDQVLASRGDVPELRWISAFFAGSEHLNADDRHGFAPSDIVWARLDPTRLGIAAGRQDRPFHFRERQRVALLAQIVGGLLASR
jgi:hypothetical protein